MFSPLTRLTTSGALPKGEPNICLALWERWQPEADGEGENKVLIVT